MPHVRMPIAVLGIGLIAGLALAELPALGQTQPAPGSQPAGAGAASEHNGRVPYSAGMGEIMAMGVQPRHIAMAAAVRAGDWGYAAYAVKELGETFERIPRAIPNYQNHNTADLIGGFIKAPLSALDQAVKASDAARFKTAYAQLTEGCNGCHQATGRAAIVIKIANSSRARADQEFKPSKP